jgi:hypothetical protein
MPPKSSNASTCPRTKKGIAAPGKKRRKIRRE